MTNEEKQLFETLFETLPQTPREQRWREQVGPVMGVLALIQRRHENNGRQEERFLLIQRRKPPYAGKWALVGGKVEFGETLAQAAVREVREETGLESEFMGVRGVVNERIVPDPAAGEGLAGHFLLFACAMNAPVGVAREQAEGKVAWFTFDELEQIQEQGELVASDYAMIRHFGLLETSVPYYEVEMVARDENEANSPAARMSRFQRIV